MKAQPEAVVITPSAADAYGICGVLPVGAVIITPNGTVLVVQSDGGVDPVYQGGRPHGGIAEDPTARRKARP